MATSPPSDLIVKFDSVTDASTFPSITTTALTSGTGINFNLQIIEKGIKVLGTDPSTVGSTKVGSDTDEINNITSQELANLITQYFSDKSILAAAAGTGSNIRSMKLIVNIDPTV